MKEDKTMAGWSEQAINAWREGLGGGKIRQHANESPWDIPADLKAEILETMAQLPFGRYDFALRQQLTAAVSRYSGVPAEQIVLGNGADELIQVCMMSLPAAAGRIIITSPTFIVYPMTAAALRREVVDVPLLEPGFRLDSEALVRTARPGDLVFICRPNNPTGNLFRRDQVEATVQALTGCGVRVVIDEAYYEFCGETMADLVLDPGCTSVVVLRTLSKAFRLAGLRIGYALVAPPLVQSMERARLLYNLSAASTVGALGVLSRPEMAQQTAAEVAALRDRLAADLATVPGVTVHPSVTNFILVDITFDAPAVARVMSQQGILIRDYPGEPGLEQSLRISVGTASDNERVVSALAATLADLSARRQPRE